MKKRRADEALMEQLALEKIELARALIMEGRVMSGDRKILRASEMIGVEEKLRVRGEIDSYVSRGAYKLKRAIEVFGLDLNGKTCIDVGASTGGFTDVMLRAGAKKVYSVDVGYNLLDYRLRRDERVVAMEKTNARFLKPEDFPDHPEFGATDVSFISLKAVLPAALSVLQPGVTVCGADQAAIRSGEGGRGREGRCARSGSASARARGYSCIRAVDRLARDRAGLFADPRSGGQYRVPSRAVRPSGGRGKHLH